MKEHTYVYNAELNTHNVIYNIYGEHTNIWKD